MAGVAVAIVMAVTAKWSIIAGGGAGVMHLALVHFLHAPPAYVAAGFATLSAAAIGGVAGWMAYNIRKDDPRGRDSRVWIYGTCIVAGVAFAAFMTGYIGVAGIPTWLYLRYRTEDVLRDTVGAPLRK